jgi:hypothetical protein
MTLEKYATQLAWLTFEDVKRQADKDKYSIDPITILAIVNIIINLARCLLEYFRNDSTKAVNAMGKLSYYQKFMMYRRVRGMSSNRREALYIYNSMLKVMSELSYEEKIKLFTLN